MEIKIRYTWKRGSDGNIIQRVVDLTSLEEKGLILDFSGYRLIARDLWTGTIDKKKNDIFNGDTLFVKYNKSYLHGEVKWIDHGWKIDCGYPKLFAPFGLSFAKKSEITGNIHSTPKL